MEKIPATCVMQLCMNLFDWGKQVATREKRIEDKAPLDQAAEQPGEQIVDSWSVEQSCYSRSNLQGA